MSRSTCHGEFRNSSWNRRKRRLCTKRETTRSTKSTTKSASAFCASCDFFPLSALRSAKDVVNVGSFLCLQVKVEPAQSFLQIVQIEVSELEKAVSRANPQRRSAGRQRGLAYKVALGFEDSSDLPNGLILISK